MKLWKYLAFAVIAAILLAWPIMQIISAGMLMGVTSDIQGELDKIEEDGRPNEKFFPAMEIQSAQAPRDGYKHGYVALTYHDVLQRSRVVDVRTQVKLTDLLTEGETLPEDLLLPAFVMARAPRIADAECRALEAVLARSCVVVSATGQPAKDGLANVFLSMNFVQKDPFGAPPAAPRAAYAEVEALPSVHPAKEIALSGASAFRQGVYRQVAERCRGLQALQGNCAIYRVSIYTNPTSKSASRLEVKPSATLSTLTAL